MKLPTDLNVYMTSKCNFKCKHCLRRVAVPQANDVTVDLLEKVFELYPIKSVCLAGFGEPLLNPHILDIVKFLNKRNIKPGLITNGSKLIEFAKSLTSLDLAYLSISLNESGAISHKKTSGTETFADIVKGVVELEGKVDYPIGVSKVCFKGELESIPDFLRLAAILNVDFVHLTNNLPYSKEVYSKIITERDKKDLAYLGKCTELPQAKLVKRWPTILRKMCPGTCNSPWNSMGVDGDGFISGCRRIFGPDKKFGHFNELAWEAQQELLVLKEGIKGEGKYAKTCRLCFGNHK